MLISELEDLIDCIDILIFEDEPSIFTEEFAIQLVETSLQLMDEFLLLNPHIISEPAFCNILLEEIKDIFYIQMEDHIEMLDNGEDIEDDMNELIEEAFTIFITIFHPDKLIGNIYEHIENNEEESNIIKEKIQKLREMHKPV